jgi:hypothetical protein
MADTTPHQPGTSTPTPAYGFESGAVTAVASPAGSKDGSANGSVYEKEVDAEKGDSFEDNSLASYAVPVLEKGVKSALTKPVTRWTKFRVWYNPYRQVKSSSLFKKKKYCAYAYL